MPRVLSPADVADFRDRLCDAAELRFATQGLESLTLRHLAADLGVSPMTPYRYFKDKDAILAAVRARAFDRFAAALEAATAQNSAGQAYIAFALGAPAAYRLMFDVNQPTFSEYPDLVHAMERARATMTSHLESLVAEGKFVGDVALAGHAYWAALHGAIMLHLTGLLPDKPDVGQIVGELAHALDARYAAPAAKT